MGATVPSNLLKSILSFSLSKATSLLVVSWSYLGWVMILLTYKYTPYDILSNIPLQNLESLFFVEICVIWIGVVMITHPDLIHRIMTKAFKFSLRTHPNIFVLLGRVAMNAVSRRHHPSEIIIEPHHTICVTHSSLRMEPPQYQ